MTATHICDYTKDPGIVPVKWVTRMAREVHLSTAAVTTFDSASFKTLISNFNIYHKVNGDLTDTF